MSATGPALVGVLLAAGRGRRMGRAIPKQLLPWPPGGATPMVAASFDAIAPACSAMIVVLDHGAEEIVAALGERVFESARSDGDAAMLASIAAGLCAARAPAETHHATGVLLHPADHPAVAAGTLDALRAAHRASPGQVITPAHRGLGGHPILIPIDLVDLVLREARDGGLRRLWRDRPGLRRRIEVDDASVVRDVDTPQDYAAGAGS